jgi:hypothetical protein
MYGLHSIVKEIEMPYREKIAWLSIVALVVTFGAYFAVISRGYLPGLPLPNFPRLAFFAAATLVQVLILGGGHLYLRLQSPEEARIPPDERDRAILRRSMTSAYYVLLSGMIMVGCIMPFNSSGWKIVDAAVFMIVAAEIVRYGVIVVSYRVQG